MESISLPMHQNLSIKGFLALVVQSSRNTSWQNLMFKLRFVEILAGRLYKDQIAFQRERFFQIYPGGGYRRPTNRPQPRRRREEPLDDQHIPDIEELTREEEEMEEGDEEYYSSSTDDGSREEEGGVPMAFFSQPRRMRLEYKHHQHHSHHSEQL